MSNRHCSDYLPNGEKAFGPHRHQGQESVFFPELAREIKVDLSVAVCRNSWGLSAASKAIGTPANLKVSGCKEKGGGHEERGNYRVTAPSRRL